jgi:hypothetical protein
LRVADHGHMFEQARIVKDRTAPRIRRAGVGIGVLALAIAAAPGPSLALTVSVPTVTAPSLPAPGVSASIPLPSTAPAPAPTLQVEIPPPTPAPPAVQVPTLHAPSPAPLPRVPHVTSPLPSPSGTAAPAAPLGGVAASSARSPHSTAGPGAAGLARVRHRVHARSLRAHAASAAPAHAAPSVASAPAPTAFARGGPLAAPLSSRGLASARYVTPALPDPPTQAASPGTTVLGVPLSPAARDSLIAAFLIFGLGALIFAAMFADGLGIGPRHAVWRQRLRQRWGTPSLRLPTVRAASARASARLRAVARLRRRWL